MTTVALLGTLDTKGEECAYLRRKVEEAGCDVVLIDGGVLGDPLTSPDVTSAEVAAAAGDDLAALRERRDRGAAVRTMARGAAEILVGMLAEGALHAALGVGGSGGSSLAGMAMQALPVGVPKLIVSTMASGDTRPYVGVSDVTMMHSVVDISGINTVSGRILSNAAAAAAGMAAAYEAFGPLASGRPVIGATMFGVTTEGVTAARRWLEEHGYEVLVFHATGTGGMAMESLIEAGYVTGSLDMTTTELVDELIGGVLSAGPERLEAAGRAGIPQVVSLGALDMGNFGPIGTVPERYRHRTLYEHNPSVTLMRTNPDECAELGRTMADKLNRATGPLTVFVPCRGISAIAMEGERFHDAVADSALIGKLLANLDASIEVVEMNTDINDPAFATAMAETLDRHHRSWATGHQSTKEQERTEQKGGRGIGEPQT